MKIQLGSFPIPDREKYLPYSSGLLESVVKKDLTLSHVEFETPLWDYGQSPIDNLDILGLTNYVWSQDYCDELAEEYKKSNPDSIIIFGGPNVPTDESKWQEYQDERPFVDVFVAGSGEEVFLSILKSFPNLNKWYKLDKDKKYRYDTPTAYVDGTFDKFFEGTEDFNVAIETNRGCPFQCSFCDWGDATGSIVSKFDDDVNYKTIEKVLKSERVKGIRVVDANWGMYERDLDMTKYMAEIKRPDQHITFCGIAKNSTKYTPEIAKIFYDHNFMGVDNLAQPLKIGVQTWHPTTLEYNARDNIKESAFIKLLDFYKKHDIPYVSELIMGLPGETPESWLYTLDKDFELGVQFQNIYPLEIVANMPLLQEDYDLEFQDVWIHKDLVKMSDRVGAYHRKPDSIHESESTNKRDYIVRKLLKSCFSYTTDELMKIYDYTWWMNTFFGTRILKDIRRPSDEILDFFDRLDSMPFWKSQIERHRSNFKEAFVDGKVTSVHAARYWMKTLNRSDEIIQIYSNFEQAQDELNKEMVYIKPSLKMYNYGWQV